LLSLFLTFSLSLVLTSGAAAQSQSGVEVRGTAVLHGPRGDELGAISIEAADAAHCRVTITLGPEVLHREYTAVLNGKRAQVSGLTTSRTRLPAPAAASSRITTRTGIW
jgi:hypothetical protein